METLKAGGKIRGTEVDLYEVCGFLKETLEVLDYPRRIAILNALQPDVTYTFEQLKAKTELSTGSLHHHLKELRRAGFVYKTSERPGRYGRTDAVTHLISLIAGDGDVFLGAGVVGESEQMFMGAAEELTEHGNGG
jgi:DNA-binding HxlR family transcriptional regulator